MQEYRMDAFDLAILRALQADGALTSNALAEIVNLSPSQCARRRAALETARIIERYSAIISRQALGKGFKAYVRVSLDRHGHEQERALHELIARRNEVQSAHSVSGDADYVLEVCVGSLEEFASFIHDHLVPVPHLREVRSEISLKVVKSYKGIPF